MTTFLVILTIIVAILLVLIIMVQNPKGGGLSSTFGGGGMNIGGVQNTNTFLDKSTWTLAAVMIGLILFINLTHPNRHGSTAAKSSIENTLDEAELPAENPTKTETQAPAAQTPAQEQPAK